MLIYLITILYSVWCLIFPSFSELPIMLFSYWRKKRVPWTARRWNQSILKEISTEYSLEGLPLKLQYFDPLIRRDDSLEKTLMQGKIEGRRRRGWTRMRWLDGITNSVDASSRRWWRTGKPGVLQFMGVQRVKHDLATKQQQIILQRIFLLMAFFLLNYFFRILLICVITRLKSRITFSSFTFCFLKRVFQCTVPVMSTIVLNFVLTTFI